MPLRYSLACLLLAAAVSHAQPALVPQDHNLDVKEHYTKYEYRIPMRDGKKLFTAVYVPKDPEQTYPLLMTRTPYSVRPYGVDQYKSDLGPSPMFGRELRQPLALNSAWKATRPVTAAAITNSAIFLISAFRPSTLI